MAAPRWKVTTTSPGGGTRTDFTSYDSAAEYWRDLCARYPTHLHALYEDGKILITSKPTKS